KRTICIPVDESKTTTSAIQWAIDHLIQPETDQVILLNVRESPQTGAYPLMVSESTYDFLATKLKEHSHDLLRTKAKLLTSLNIHVRAISLCGVPKIELEYKINQLQPSLVIMGKRGMGVVKSLLIGSVSEHLLHHVKVPITI
ncbi:hypothetical protein BC833DRAFT_517754, partial [Globomyces pollinis-pini]